MTYFTRKEFACKCGCGFAAKDEELTEVLTDVRIWSGGEVYLTGNRCLQHNTRIRLCTNHGDFYGDACPECGLPGKQRSSKTSYHMKGMATDTTAKNKSPREMYDYLCNKYPDKYGIILYKAWVHLDMRSEPYRKDKTL